jgi:hypothetical protein
LTAPRPFAEAAGDMDPNLHFALVAATHLDDLTGALKGKTGGAVRAVLEGMSTDGEIEDGLIIGPELSWTHVAESFTQLYGWGSDAAAVRDLSGIEDHPEIELINLPFSAVDRIEPLAALTALRRLRLNVTEACDLAPLLALEKLERVAIYNARSAAQAGVLASLAARGVHADGAIDWKAVAAPFEHRMLKLAVLDTLAGSGALALPKVFVIDEYALDEGNLARVLASVPPGDARLSTVTSLGWAGGGFDIQHLVYPQWDGESEDFDVTDLGGIEALAALKKLQITPLESIPEAQLAALRARGIEISSY